MSPVAADIEPLLAALVAIDSTSDRSNLPVIDLLQKRLDAVGARTHRVPMPEGDKANLIAIIGPECNDGRGLTLCGHVDTVPADEEGWTSDPRTLTTRDERWYARGACDMKGFVAIATAMLEAADANALAAPLALVVTCDEEIGSLGAADLRRTGMPERLPTAMIIGEPTSLQAVRMHKGHLALQIRITGVPAHTGSPHLGRNAVEAGGRVAAALADLATTLKQESWEHGECFADVPFPVLAVVAMGGGDAVNVVPDRCVMTCGLRCLPGQDPSTLIARIEAAIAAATDLPWTLDRLRNNPAMLTATDAPLHSWLKAHLGQEGDLGVSYGTDGGHLCGMDFDCVVWGPGDIGVAHKCDEFVPIAEIDAYCEALEATIGAFCMDGAA